MSDIDKKRELIDAVVNAQLIPVDTDEDFSEQGYTKIPFGDIAALGIAVEPIIATLQKMDKVDFIG